MVKLTSILCKNYVVKEFLTFYCIWSHVDFPLIGVGLGVLANYTMDYLLDTW